MIQCSLRCSLKRPESFPSLGIVAGWRGPRQRSSVEGDQTPSILCLFGEVADHRVRREGVEWFEGLFGGIENTDDESLHYLVRWPIPDECARNDVPGSCHHYW